MSRIVDPILEGLRRKLIHMGNAAEAVLEKSVRALVEVDTHLAKEVQQDDLEIDRLDVEIDEAVLRALALQAPVADDLRQVVAVKMVASDLERVGDIARNVATSAVRLAGRSPGEFPPRLIDLARDARGLLRTALDAYADLDVAKAQAVLDADDQVDQEEELVIREAIAEMGGEPERNAVLVEFILVAKNLERVADHATNIAEDVVLAARGENLKHAGKLGAGSPGAALQKSGMS
jgi:phosphate transport system protein